MRHATTIRPARFLSGDAVVAIEESIMPDTKPTDATPDNFGKIATDTAEAGVADETASYDEAMALSEEDAAVGNGTRTTPTEGGDAEIESAAQPS